MVLCPTYVAQDGTDTIDFGEANGVGPDGSSTLAHTMREQLFHLSPNSSMTLQNQLREMLVTAILDGHIPGGSPLPSGRRLAEQLGVSRNTVVLAYQHLVDEGFLVSRERSGYYVNEEILAGRVRPQARAEVESTSQPAWSERIQLKPSEQRNISKPRDWDKYPYPFIYGQFDPSLFPISEWRECCRQALSVVAVRDWLRDSIDGDDPFLIERLHTRVLPRRGVWANSDEILITVGAQQALYLISNLLMHDNTVVGMENPGYPDARNIFSIRTKRLKPLQVDASGLVISNNLNDCDYLYVTPSHQFPTTATLPLDRRTTLLERAANSDTVIIEDDYETEANFSGQPTPALKSLDTHGRVIYVGSLSKSLAPGLRLGYLVGPAELIREARALRRLMLRHPPTNNQRTIGLFIARGHYDALLSKVGNAYGERWKVMNAALDQYLPECTRVPNLGGSACWLAGPKTLDCKALEYAAGERGIIVEPGDVCFMDNPPPRNYFRLGLSSIPLDRIEPGIRQLAEVVRKLGTKATA
jgi:GntR family transcriptional regulator/MocR family aminotransferase